MRVILKGSLGVPCLGYKSFRMQQIIIYLLRNRQDSQALGSNHSSSFNRHSDLVFSRLQAPSNCSREQLQLLQECPTTTPNRSSQQLSLCKQQAPTALYASPVGT
jgi:hypothetical protein